MVSQTKGLSNQLDDVKKQLDENKVKDPELNAIAKEAKQDLDNAAEKPMTDAAQQLNGAQQSKGNPSNPKQQQQAKENRSKQLAQSEQSQSAGRPRLQDAMDKMDKVGNLSTAIKEMQKIADTPGRAQKPAQGDRQGNPRQEARGPDPRAEEEARRPRQAAEGPRRADGQGRPADEQDGRPDGQVRPESAQAMKDAAQQAQNQQISPQQRQAAQQAQQNQQAQAQNAQQQAQIGIEVVLNTLKDAERRKLEQPRQAPRRRHQEHRRPGHAARPVTTSITSTPRAATPRPRP